MMKCAALAGFFIVLLYTHARAEEGSLLGKDNCGSHSHCSPGFRCCTYVKGRCCPIDMECCYPVFNPPPCCAVGRIVTFSKPAQDMDKNEQL